MWRALTSICTAEHSHHASITSGSNSSTKREFIDGEERMNGSKNLSVRTANMIDYQGEGAAQCDRMVSVEMLEHISPHD